MFIGVTITREGEKMECRVSIVKMNRQPYGGRLTLEFDVDWILASPTQEVETELNNRLQELKILWKLGRIGLVRCQDDLVKHS